MSTHDISDSTFENEVLQADKTVLVDFWAEWCGPCKMLSPILHDLAASMSNELKIVKINVDTNPHSPSKYGVSSIPTLILFKNGVVIDKKVGVIQKSNLEKWVRSA